ncbi:MAG TPA: right-handed parallel beta-helix repeat-containing protein [Thermoleophilaceae bacterium]
MAAPGGSNSAAGTEAAPYATAQKLVDSLDPGEIGCLRQGTYTEDVTIDRGGGGDASRVVVRSYPGERAKIAGRLYVTDDANYVTVEQLDLNGHDSGSCTDKADCVLPSPTVNGDHVTFQDNDVTNDHRGICFNLGNHGYGRAVADVIQRNRIHDCGVLPANNHEHGIYLTWTEDTRILSNVIYDNADRGIQLYPDAQHTLISGNVIDGNGEGVIFSGVGQYVSNDNVLENNVITNSKLRNNVESYYPDLIGARNVVRNNCVHGGEQGNISKGAGFVAIDNLTADPQYVDRAGKDFRLSPGSPCAGVLDGATLPDAPTAGASDKPSAGSGEVVVSRATLSRSRRNGRRWRLHIDGRLRGVRGTRRSVVQIRRGGSWQRLGTRRIRRNFRVSVNPRIPRLHGARVTTVRVVVPGVAKSRAVSVRVRG